jgi:7-dehydrocholesterol reductase
MSFSTPTKNNEQPAANGSTKSVKYAQTTTFSVSQDWSGSGGVLPGREAFGPIFLMIVCPIFSIVYVHVVSHMDGNFVAFANLCLKEGFFTVLNEIWPDSYDPQVWKMILGFFAFELILQRFLPGKRFEASITPAGNVPVYTANGMQAFLVTILTGLVLDHLGYIQPSLVYDKFGNIIASLNIFSWAWCFMLLLKGHIAPSTTDSGTTGSWVYDFFWGMGKFGNWGPVTVSMMWILAHTLSMLSSRWSRR